MDLKKAIIVDDIFLPEYIKNADEIIIKGQKDKIKNEELINKFREMGGEIEEIRSDFFNISDREEELVDYILKKNPNIVYLGYSPNLNQNKTLELLNENYKFTFYLNNLEDIKKNCYG